MNSHDTRKVAVLDLDTLTDEELLHRSLNRRMVRAGELLQRARNSLMPLPPADQFGFPHNELLGAAIRREAQRGTA